MRTSTLAFATVMLSLLVIYLLQHQTVSPWTPRELELISSLRLTTPPMPPADASNAVADNPTAAELGHLLFFDTRLSANGEVACNSCHQTTQRFADGKTTATTSLGKSARNTMSLVGASFSSWFYWDGRKDSQWSQALAPLEDPNEHGSNRMRLARLVTEDTHYRTLYSAAFGNPPDFSDATRFPTDASPASNALWQSAWGAMSEADRKLVNQTFANIGKALAAYERKLLPGVSKFDIYAESLALNTNEDSGNREIAADIYNDDEINGLRLFMGKARCIECHNGPLFTNNEFHNTGLLPPAGNVPDRGRIGVLKAIQSDVFNCRGEFSDASPPSCNELNYMRTGPELVGAMRTPSLRNLADTAPYMHKGQLATLSAVLEHYNRAPFALIGHNETEPLKLSRQQLRQLEAFILTLDAPPAASAQWLTPPNPDR